MTEIVRALLPVAALTAAITLALFGFVAGRASGVRSATYRHRRRAAVSWSRVTRPAIGRLVPVAAVSAAPVVVDAVVVHDDEEDPGDRDV